MGVIGGRGGFGRWCQELFAQRGHPVQIADRDTPLSNREVAASSDIVIVAVPIGCTAEVLAEVAAAVDERAVVVELTSVKTPFLATMRQIPATVLSLHPLFSPRQGYSQSQSDPRGQTCIVCEDEMPTPARSAAGLERARYVQEVFAACGITLVPMTPDRHDRLMAVVQGLTHLQSMVAAHCLAGLGFDIQESLEVASPVYRVRLAFIGRVVAQNPRLFAEIQVYNPYVREVLEQHQRSARLLAELVERGDVDSIVAEMSVAKAAFGAYCEQALAESEVVIEAVRQHLIAQQPPE